jgi:hypothetical protein
LYRDELFNIHTKYDMLVDEGKMDERDAWTWVVMQKDQAFPADMPVLFVTGSQADAKNKDNKWRPDIVFFRHTNQTWLTIIEKRDLVKVEPVIPVCTTATETWRVMLDMSIFGPSRCTRVAPTEWTGHLRD